MTICTMGNVKMVPLILMHPLRKTILLPKINLYVPCRSAGSLSGPLRVPPQLVAATVIVYVSPCCGLILSHCIEHV